MESETNEKETAVEKKPEAEAKKDSPKQSRKTRKNESLITSIREQLCTIDAKITADGKEMTQELDEVEGKRRERISEATLAATNIVGSAERDRKEGRAKAQERKNAAIKAAEQAYQRECAALEESFLPIRNEQEAIIRETTELCQVDADAKRKGIQARHDAAMAPILEERTALVDQLWELNNKKKQAKAKADSAVAPETVEGAVLGAVSADALPAPK